MPPVSWLASGGTEAHTPQAGPAPATLPASYMRAQGTPVTRDGAGSNPGHLPLGLPAPSRALGWAKVGAVEGMPGDTYASGFSLTVRSPLLKITAP